MSSRTMLQVSTALMLALALPAGAARSAGAGRVEVNDKVSPYRIAGNSADELREQMKRLGPTDESGRTHFSAMTYWNVSWAGNYVPGKRSCKLSDFEITVDVDIHVPEWQPPRAATPELRATWDRFMERLMAHEQGHRAIAVQAANKLRSELAALPPHPDCKMLDRRVGDTGRRVLEAANRADDEYDRHTGHGEKQGVAL